jgi:O-antigen/teichoic acid export membrane protein
MVPLVFISINFLFAAATTQLTNLLNAIGRIKNTFYLMIMWTVLTWVFVPALAYKFGVVGASIGYSIVGASSIIAMIIAKKYVNFSITESMLKPGIAAFVMGVILYIAKSFLPVTLPSAGMLLVLGIAVYGGSMLAIVGISLVEDTKRSLRTLLNRA